MAKNINLQIPLKSEEQNFFDGNRETSSAINENIKSVLLTRKFERPISEVGLRTSVLHSVLFEPINQQEMESRLTREISEQLNKYIVDERGNRKITIRAIKLYTKEKNPQMVGDYNSILVKLVYSINNLNEDLNIEELPTESIAVNIGVQ